MGVAVIVCAIEEASGKGKGSAVKPVESVVRVFGGSDFARLEAERGHEQDEQQRSRIWGKHQEWIEGRTQRRSGLASIDVGGAIRDASGKGKEPAVELVE
jgi:hypothetical protein